MPKHVGRLPIRDAKIIHKFYFLQIKLQSTAFATVVGGLATRFFLFGRSCGGCFHIYIVYYILCFHGCIWCLCWYIRDSCGGWGHGGRGFLFGGKNWLCGGYVW